jgi:hypothetical protein
LPFDENGARVHADRMNALLPLADLTSLLPPDQPFTPAMARAAGISRSALERMRRDGLLRRPLRGVYVSTAAEDTPALRAATLRLAVTPDAVVVDRTAGWVHGFAPCAAPDAQPPVEVLAPRRPGARAGSRRIAPRDLMLLSGLRLTTPLRTALDLARTLAPTSGLAVLDELLASGAAKHMALLSELPRFTGLGGVSQLRCLVAQADGRSREWAESVLRLRWHRAELPTATPGLVVAAGPRAVRLALGVEGRRFGAVLAHTVTAEDLLALEGAGWRVVVLARDRVLHSDHTVWVSHLEREWHQHLLAELEVTERQL